MQNMGAEAMPI